METKKCECCGIEFSTEDARDRYCKTCEQEIYAPHFKIETPTEEEKVEEEENIN